jgi:hypothetical protein
MAFERRPANARAASTDSDPNFADGLLGESAFELADAQ